MMSSSRAPISRYLTLSVHTFWTLFKAPMRGLYNTTCEVICDMEKGTTYLSKTHYAEEILRTYNFWDATPCLTPMQPNTRLN